MTANGAQGDSTRRVYPRLDLEVEVDFSSEHNFYTGFTENISEGGMFIATHQYLEKGARFRFKFTLPGVSGEIEALAEVRWVREHNPMTAHMTPGMGVTFLEIGDASVRRIKQFIQRREPMFFDEDLDL